MSMNQNNQINPLLEEKLKELEEANDFACWYLVKQNAEFDKLCYLVGILEVYQQEKLQEEPEKPAPKLEDYIKDVANKLNMGENLDIPGTHRALRVAAAYGLIKMPTNRYEAAEITETFREIKKRCAEDYKEKELYADIIRRQIEKLYCASEIDEGSEGVRKEYRLYPVMLLYKVLLELGQTTGEYRISMTEYRYLVATTKRFRDVIRTLLLIHLLRADRSGAKARFEQYKDKFDNRMNQALKQLDTLDVGQDYIALRPEHMEEVAERVARFARDPEQYYDPDTYLDFLCSTESLVPLNAGTAPPAPQPPQSPQSPRLTGGANILYYGVPGCGKSHLIQESDYYKNAAKVERVVFHPDYTYGDFVGQIMPRARDGKVGYDFAPGPFTRILKEAWANPGEPYCLIVEEINRGNAPAIFGDVFQLLDRDPEGNGSYAITNADMAACVGDMGFGADRVKLPSNLWLLATMNTSDQNVFTLDTAFQRRWRMRLVKNDVDAAELAQVQVLDTGVTWGTFNKTINGLILDRSIGQSSTEDKQMGAWFVQKEDLEFTGDAEHDRIFPEKVLKYLWDDALKFAREEVFRPECNSLEKLISAFSGASGPARFLAVFQDNLFGVKADGES